MVISISKFENHKGGRENMPSKENWPYMVNFCILENTNESRYSKDTKVAPHWVKEQLGPLN